MFLHPDCVAFPHLWVNGEKYIFSPEVLESGKKLFNSFCRLQQILKTSYSRSLQDNSANSSSILRFDIVRALEEFDTSWVSFEQVLDSDVDTVLTLLLCVALRDGIDADRSGR